MTLDRKSMRRHILFFLVDARELGNESIRIFAEESSFAGERTLQRGSERQKRIARKREKARETERVLAVKSVSRG